MYSFANLLPLVREVFNESRTAGRSPDEALQDVVELLLQYAGDELSTDTASRLLLSLHPASSEDLERLWEAALGHDMRKDLRQDSPVDSATSQQETSLVATSRNALGNPSPLHTAPRTQGLPSVICSSAVALRTGVTIYQAPPLLLSSPDRILPTSASSIIQSEPLKTTAPSYRAPVTETHIACLLMTMRVFPDIPRSRVVSLIQARFDHSLSVDGLSDIVISELLDAKSYPNSEQGNPVDGEDDELPDEGPASLHSLSPFQSRTASPIRSAISNTSCGGLGVFQVESPSYNPWDGPGDGQASKNHLSQDSHYSSL